MRQKFSLLSICILVLVNSIALGQVPISKQATLVETVSSAEVLIEATGIYHGEGRWDWQKRNDVDDNGMSGASLDAKKSAVYFVLYTGTDPLLSNTDEQLKFKGIETEFFKSANISKYVTYEDLTVIKKVKIDDGTGVRLTKRFKVSKDLIAKYLETSYIIAPRVKLADKMGNPFIMVLPAVKKGQSPIDFLRNNSEAKHAAAVIESYLTARQYDVIVPEQQASMEALNAGQLALGDREEDYAYQLALSVGSDVYIEFSGTLEDAGYGTKKYAMAVRAFETTTARLLGAETGYSQGRKGETMVSIEEAMNDAIDKVLSRITNYWKQDVINGVQYKLVFSVAPGFDEDQLDKIQFAVADVIEKISKKSKENLITKQTIDYLIWCDPAVYEKSSKVYRDVKKYFDDQGTHAILRQVNVNRKMILLKIDNE